jgi:hypothetical protein
MGTNVQMIDATYGHLVHDVDEHDRGLLDAYDAAEAEPNGHVTTMRVVRRALKQLAELGVVVTSCLPFRDRL